MAPVRGPKLEMGLGLRNETAVNVAGLLKGATGTTRHYRMVLDHFPLDAETAAEVVAGDVRLTRLRDGIMANVRVEGVVPLECVRCLRLYNQPFRVEFGEEFRQTVDLRTGVDLEPAADEDDDTARIDENHELDLGEVLRQEILVALPMRADCGDACAGPDVLAAETFVAETDDAAERTPFAALASLLDEEETVTTGGRRRSNGS